MRFWGACLCRSDCGLQDYHEHHLHLEAFEHQPGLIDSTRLLTVFAAVKQLNGGFGKDCEDFSIKARCVQQRVRLANMSCGDGLNTPGSPKDPDLVIRRH